MRSDRVEPDHVRRFYENADATPPSFGGSVFNSFKESALGGLAAIATIGEGGGVGSQEVQDAYLKVQIENQREDELTTTGQMGARKVASTIPSILGMVLDPISMATGFVGGAATRGAIKYAAPKVIEKTAARRALESEIGTKAATEALPRTLGEIGVAGAEGAGTMAGFSIPTAILHNYEQDTRHINFGGLATEVLTNGAMGIGFGVLGYGAGVLWKSWFPKESRIPTPGTAEIPNQLKMLENKFQAGEIPKHEYELMRDYMTNPHDTTLNKRFADVMLGRGHDINTANYRAYFEMINNEDMHNLKTILPFELNNHELATDKNALSQFTLHNRLDEIREKPELVNGLHGYVNEADYKLAHKADKLKEADKILDNHIFKELTKNEKKELKHLRKFFLGEKGLPREFKKTKEYNKLRDMSERLHNAKSLLDRINLEHEYERQEAFRDVAKAFIDVLNSNIDKFANSNRVDAYLKERIAQSTAEGGERRFDGKTVSISEIGKRIKEQRKLPSDAEVLLNEFQQHIDSVNAPELKSDFNAVRSRYEQFKDNEKALSDMIDCFGRK